MSPRLKTTLTTITLIVIGLAAIFMVILSWLYSGQLTLAKVSIFQKLPLPLALVNGQSVQMRDFILRQRVAEAMSQGQDIPGPDSKINSRIYAQLIAEQEIKGLAARYKISVSQKEIDQEYQANLKNDNNFSAMLAQYGLSEADFKKQVIEPQILETHLRVWFNSQADLSLNAYGQSEELLKRINNGENMAELAGQFSQDEAGKKVGGDLGFVQTTELVPELRDSLESMKVGETKVLASRFGLHIIKLEQKDSEQLHLRQIFLETSNFQAWLSSQTKNYKIHQLRNI